MIKFGSIATNTARAYRPAVSGPTDRRLQASFQTLFGGQGTVKGLLGILDPADARLSRSVNIPIRGPGAKAATALVHDGGTAVVAVFAHQATKDGDVPRGLSFDVDDPRHWTDEPGTDANDEFETVSDVESLDVYRVAEALFARCIDLRSQFPDLNWTVTRGDFTGRGDYELAIIGHSAIPLANVLKPGPLHDAIAEGLTSLPFITKDDLYGGGAHTRSTRMEAYKRAFGPDFMLDSEFQTVDWKRAKHFSLNRQVDQFTYVQSDDLHHGFADGRTGTILTDFGPDGLERVGRPIPLHHRACAIQDHGRYDVSQERRLARAGRTVDRDQPVVVAQLRLNGIHSCLLHQRQGLSGG